MIWLVPSSKEEGKWKLECVRCYMLEGQERDSKCDCEHEDICKNHTVV